MSNPTEIEKWLQEQQALIDEMVSTIEQNQKDFGESKIFIPNGNPVDDLSAGVIEVAPENAAEIWKKVSTSTQFVYENNPLKGKIKDASTDTPWKNYYYSEDGHKTEYDRRRTPENRWRRARYDAKRRSTGVKEFTITMEEYCEFIKQPCYYCNCDISTSSGSGMDRIENSKGYLLDNVVPCCRNCNRIRGDTMSSAEFKKQSFINGRWKE